MGYIISLSNAYKDPWVRSVVTADFSFANPILPNHGQSIKAEHECTCGWPGSVPVGLNSLRTQTQICAGCQTQVTWIHRSSTCQNAGTCPRSGSCRYFKIFISPNSYLYVLIQRNSMNICFTMSMYFGTTDFSIHHPIHVWPKVPCEWIIVLSQSMANIFFDDMVLEIK